MASAPYTVGDVMTTTVVTVTPDAGFQETVAALRGWRVTAAPVIEGEGRVVGVVSEADLLCKVGFHERRVSMQGPARDRDGTVEAGARRVADVMTAPALTVAPDASLAEAARVMSEHHVKRLPVVDEKGVVKGIVSRPDLLKVFLRPDTDIAEEIREDVIDRLFPVSHRGIRVEVDRGVVTLSGEVRDATLVPAAVRLAQAVGGVVAVRSQLVEPPPA